MPDAVLFVGDLSDGDLCLVKSIKELGIPTALILGNHDRGRRDPTGSLLRSQLSLLGEIHCAWRWRKWDKPQVAVIGARPCSSGGGFRIAEAVESVYGQITLQESVDRIVLAASLAPPEWPLILLAHSGPTGLGSDANSLCGRDWKVPALDWGDKDLEIAIDQIRKKSPPDLVVFGHMHHALKRGKGDRKTFFEDVWGTYYLNAACVPRRGIDSLGRNLSHLSWVEFRNSKLSFAAHRWYLPDASIAYEQTLFCR